MNRLIEFGFFSGNQFHEIFVTLISRKKSVNRSITILGGNLFFVLCIICNTSLQRPGHFFIASLAITDLLLALTVMVPRLSEDILGVWHFGFLMCQVRKIFGFF